MSKSIKLKNDIYFDTKSISHNRRNLYEFLEEVKEQVDKTQFYQNDEVYELTDILYVDGTLTTGRTEVVFSVFLPKSLKNISSINVSNTKMVVRCDGNYIVGGSSNYIPVDLSVKKCGDNILTFAYKSSSALGTLNNTAIALAIQGMKLIFKK